MKSMKVRFAAAIGVFVVSVFSFMVMPYVLAATSSTLDIQSVKENTITLNESNPAANAQIPDINAISEAQAIGGALKTLESFGFDEKEFRKLPIETQYISGTAPAGDPVWTVIFRNDQEGYDYVFGSDVNDETRNKIAAHGNKVEECTDENGIPGIRAYYNYTWYTVVEINALNGQYIRHGSNLEGKFGEPLNMDEIYWAPVTEEEWEQEVLRQKKLQRKAD